MRYLLEKQFTGTKVKEYIVLSQSHNIRVYSL